MKTVEINLIVHAGVLTDWVARSLTVQPCSSRWRGQASRAAVNHRLPEFQSDFGPKEWVMTAKALTPVERQVYCNQKYRWYDQKCRYTSNVTSNEKQDLISSLCYLLLN